MCNLQPFKLIDLSVFCLIAVAVTQNRSHDLAQRISSNHIQVPIGTIVNAVVMVFTSVTGFIPKYKVRGGSNQENIALQNIQARIRSVLFILFFI